MNENNARMVELLTAKIIEAVAAASAALHESFPDYNEEVFYVVWAQVAASAALVEIAAYRSVEEA